MSCGAGSRLTKSIGLRASGQTTSPGRATIPHLFSQYRDDNNTVYAATMNLELGGVDAREIAGWGVFPKLDQRLVLTDPHGTGVSNWQLPQWFYPDGNKPPLTYHLDRKRWRRDADRAFLQSVGRGQEFVLDLAHYPRGRRLVIPNPPKGSGGAGQTRHEW